MSGIRRAGRETAMFLPMAAVELRRLAERTPEIAPDLRHIALQLDAEAQELDTADN